VLAPLVDGWSATYLYPYRRFTPLPWSQKPRNSAPFYGNPIQVYRICGRRMSKNPLGTPSSRGAHMMSYLADTAWKFLRPGYRLDHFPFFMPCTNLSCLQPVSGKVTSLRSVYPGRFFTSPQQDVLGVLASRRLSESACSPLGHVFLIFGK
jgi:hypothetical protein